MSEERLPPMVEFVLREDEPASDGAQSQTEAPQPSGNSDADDLLAILEAMDPYTALERDGYSREELQADEDTDPELQLVADELLAHDAHLFAQEPQMPLP